MKCLVCIKQVPDTSNVEVDPVTGVLKRDGIDSKLNPYDLFALEFALELVKESGGSVDVITMGPPQAKEALVEAICMGADKGGLLSDRKFAGADVVATSYTLSQGIRMMGDDYDLIFCGKQTTDGDTAQVGPETAEFLGIPHAANVQKIFRIGDGKIQIQMNMDRFEQIQEMQLPCLITVEKDVNTPRLPSYKRKKMVKDSDIRIFTLKDLKDTDASHYGLSGSPTQVERIFPPEKNEFKEIFEGSKNELSDKIFEVLVQRKFV